MPTAAEKATAKKAFEAAFSRGKSSLQNEEPLVEALISAIETKDSKHSILTKTEINMTVRKVLKSLPDKKRSSLAVKNLERVYKAFFQSGDASRLGVSATGMGAWTKITKGILVDESKGGAGGTRRARKGTRSTRRH